MKMIARLLGVRPAGGSEVARLKADIAQGRDAAYENTFKIDKLGRQLDELIKETLAIPNGGNKK